MNESHAALVEAALLCVSEARERAENAAKALRASGNAEVAEAFARADARLFELHGDLMRSAYFPVSEASQLKLAG
jgi:hypothetical protein